MRILDWIFRDRTTGRIVVAQWPNRSLWLFAATSLTAWATDTFSSNAPSGLRIGLWLIASISLAWWALDEVFRGVNPWRRSLGAAVLLVGLWSLVVRP